MRPDRRALMGACLLIGLTTASGVRAQMTVYDPTGLAQMIKQVQQGLQQVQALQSQLTQQARMLQGLGVDVTGPLRDIAGQATSLLQQARGLGYQAASISQGFSDLYPSDLSGLSPKDLAARLAAWSQNSRQTLQEAMQVQNQIVQAQATTAGAVGAAVGASQSAAGQTAAVQATNQLLAVLSTQLTQLQTLLITQARQTETWEAERRGLVTKSEADRQRQSVVQPYVPSFNRERF
jgi:P-type conjugative transfer protein TrbJ